MKEKKYVQMENMKLLVEILNLRTNLSELYHHTGPTSSDYISLSIKLNLVVNEYFEEKITNLFSLSKDEQTETWARNELKQLEKIQLGQNKMKPSLYFKY
jgi:hypothetical protein